MIIQLYKSHIIQLYNSYNSYKIIIECSYTMQLYYIIIIIQLHNTVI